MKAAHRTQFRSQGLYWLLAAVAILVSTGAVVLRTNDDRQAGAPPVDRIEITLDRLELDPRLRSETTRNHVADIAALAGTFEPHRPEPYLALGLLRFYGEGDPLAAEEAFRAAIAIDPSFAWPYNGLALALYAQGRKTAASAAWERVRELEPDWPMPYNERAVLYRREGRLEDARKQLESALSLDPEDAITRFNYGVYWDVTGNRVRARKEYERALEQYPEMAAALYNLACSYAREGNADPALRYLREAVSLNPAFLIDARRDPDFDPIKTDERFQDALEDTR